MEKALFNSQDAQSAKLAELFVTIGDRRYTMLHAKNLEAKSNITTSDVPRLGGIINGKKATAMEIKLSMTVYKCSEMFDDLIETFKNTGILPTFDCQVTQEDKASSVGRSTKVYTGCIIDGDVLLSMFDADGEFIEQTIEAYAMDFNTAEKYKTPDYI
jgi:hypothetical protein